MSTTLPLDPDGATGNTFTLVGSSVQAALTDADDGTYLEQPDLTSGRTAVIQFEDATIPTGARVRHVRMTTRTDLWDASGGAWLFQWNSSPFLTDAPFPGTSPTDYEGPLHPTTPAGGEWTEAELDALTIRIIGGNRCKRVYELAVEVVYSSQPTVDVTSPTGTITDTSTPAISGTFSGDDPMDRFEAKVWDDATFDGGGFNPDVTPGVWESGVVLAGVIAATPDPLPGDTTYHVGVRAAGTLNGSPHWSDWAFEEFTLNPDLPGVPTIVVVAEDVRARIRLELTAGVGDAGTDAFEVQRSTDGGGTWTTVRGADRLTAIGGEALWWDGDPGNGQAAVYRARGISTDLGTDVAGDWSASTSATAWTGPYWWYKAPNRPVLNLIVVPSQIPELLRTRRSGEHEVLDRADPVFTRGVRRTAKTTASFITLTDDEADRFALLLEYDGTTLLQAPPGVRWGSKYVEAGEWREEQPGDEQDPVRVQRVQLTVTTSPSGGVDRWGASWEEVDDGHATWAVVDATFATWSELLAWLPEDA